jgi:lipoprotein NlpD
LSPFSTQALVPAAKKNNVLTSTATLTAIIVVAATVVGCATAPTIRNLNRGGPTVAVPAYYTVKSGDSLSKIALRYNLDHREIARINLIGSDYVIQVGQRLRLTGGKVSSTVAQPMSGVAEQPLIATPLAATRASQLNTTSVNPISAPLQSQSLAAYGNAWRWPTDNVILEDFDLSKKTKGIRFKGDAGDLVRAAADGTVIYASDGLPEYGNLILIQHASGYITAYAHNQRLLVQEKTRVSAGQQIAEMGNTATDQVMLEFQVRVNGKPMNPRLVLPER